MCSIRLPLKSYLPSKSFLVNTLKKYILILLVCFGIILSGFNTLKDYLVIEIYTPVDIIYFDIYDMTITSESGRINHNSLSLTSASAIISDITAEHSNFATHDLNDDQLHLYIRNYTSIEISDDYETIKYMNPYTKNRYELIYNEYQCDDETETCEYWFSD